MKILTFLNFYFLEYITFYLLRDFLKNYLLIFSENIYLWNLIQLIINKYNFKNYLEIGCDKNQSFSKIIVNNKVGVDPISGGTIRSTSDDFFLKILIIIMM